MFPGFEYEFPVYRVNSRLSSRPRDGGPRLRHGFPVFALTSPLSLPRCMNERRQNEQTRGTKTGNPRERGVHRDKGVPLDKRQTCRKSVQLRQQKTNWTCCLSLTCSKTSWNMYISSSYNRSFSQMTSASLTLIYSFSIFKDWILWGVSYSV
jgi:hypothetical protein